MPQAQIVRTWDENTQACSAYRVNEGTAQKPDWHEYIGRIDLPEDWPVMDGLQRVAWVAANRGRLDDAARAHRAASLQSAAAATDLGGGGTTSL